MLHRKLTTLSNGQSPDEPATSRQLSIAAY